MIGVRAAGAFLVGCLLLTACGGGSTGAKPRPLSSPKPSASATSSSTALTVAQAQAIAAAGVLTTADLPGYKATPSAHDPSGDAGDRAFARCAGIAVPRYRARDYGRSFNKGAIEIDSSADVEMTVAGARQQMNAFTAGSGAKCVSQALHATLAGATSTSIVAHPRPITVAGADGAFAFSFSAKASGPGGHFSATGYLLGAVVGPAEISMSTISLGSGTASLATAQHLLATVTARVRDRLH